MMTGPALEGHHRDDVTHSYFFFIFSFFFSLRNQLHYGPILLVLAATCVCTVVDDSKGLLEQPSMMSLELYLFKLHRAASYRAAVSSAGYRLKLRHKWRRDLICKNPQITLLHVPSPRLLRGGKHVSIAIE